MLKEDWNYKTMKDICIVNQGLQINISQREKYIGVFLFEKHKIKKILAMRRGLKDYRNKVTGKYPYSKKFLG